MSIEKNIQLSSGLDRTPKLTEEGGSHRVYPYTLHDLPSSFPRACRASYEFIRERGFFFFFLASVGNIQKRYQKTEVW